MKTGAKASLPSPDPTTCRLKRRQRPFVGSASPYFTPPPLYILHSTMAEDDVVLADYVCLTPCTIESSQVHPETIGDLSYELAQKGMMAVSQRCLESHPKLSELYYHCLFYAKEYLTQLHWRPQLISGSGPDPWICFGPFDGPDKNLDIKMLKYVWYSVHQEVKGKALCIQVTMVGPRMEKGEYHACPTIFTFPHDISGEFIPRLIPGNYVIFGERTGPMVRVTDHKLKSLINPSNMREAVTSPESFRFAQQVAANLVPAMSAITPNVDVPNVHVAPMFAMGYSFARVGPFSRGDFHELMDEDYFDEVHMLCENGGYGVVIMYVTVNEQGMPNMYDWAVCSKYAEDGGLIDLTEEERLKEDKVDRDFSQLIDKCKWEVRVGHLLTYREYCRYKTSGETAFEKKSKRIKLASDISKKTKWRKCLRDRSHQIAPYYVQSPRGKPTPPPGSPRPRLTLNDHNQPSPFTASEVSSPSNGTL